MVKGGRFHENLEIHKQYQKRGTKKRQKDVTRLGISFCRQNRDLNIFVIHVIEAGINSMLHYLGMKIAHTYRTIISFCEII